MAKPPCKGCDDRYVGCHENCKVYRAFLKAHNKEKERERFKKRYHLL